MTEAQKKQYKKLVENGDIKKAKDRIYWLISNFEGISTTEIERITGLKNGTVGGRLSDLQDEGKIKGIAGEKTSLWHLTTEEEKKLQIEQREKERELRAIDLLLRSNYIKREHKLAFVEAWQDLAGLNEHDFSIQEKFKIIKNYK